MIGGRKFRTLAARKRERVRVLYRTGLIVLTFCVLSVGIWYGLARPELRIQKIVVNSPGTLERDTVTVAVRAILEGTVGYVVPNDSILFMSSGTVERELRVQFPRIETVIVKRTGFGDLLVTIKEREPAALWCGDVVPPIAYSFGKAHEQGREEVWGSCYLIDHNGFIYAPAPVYTGDSFPRYYGSLERAEPIGQSVLENNEFARFQNLFSSLTHDDRVLEAVLIVDERDIEFYLSGGVRVLALRGEVPDSVARRVDALVTAGTLSTQKIIEYIDMRFDNKVFVKYVEEHTVPETTDTASID